MADVTDTSPLNGNGSGYELQSSSGLNSVKASDKSKNPWAIIRSMCIFYSVGLHFWFFTALDEEPVQKTINQGLSTALANILAIFVEVSLLGGLGVAYDQILRNFLRQKSLKHGLDDKLERLSLDSSPWNLFRRSVFLQIFRIKRLWLVGFLCAGIPFAAVFPPGALTVNFKNTVPVTLHDVPTMNISDYGNGTHQQFVEKSFFEMNGDLSYMNRLRPSLNALASQVLSSGKPVNIGSPCSSSCEYAISFDGPRFHCVERSSEDALVKNCSNPIYKAKDQIQSSPEERYSRTNNSFKISWLPTPQERECEKVKTLDCSMVLATYKLQVINSLNSSQAITVDLENEREIWTDEKWIQQQFYYYFWDRMGKPIPLPSKALHTNFTNAQAFAISRAAVNALQGEVEMFSDGFPQTTIHFSGNASLVLGSPYIGLANRYNARFNISAESIERYLQDVVVSTISLNVSTHEGGVEAKVGAEVYQFSEKLQFYAGYGACLIVAAGISLFGFLSL
ncbi:hypothetical protein F53441_10916 [Fusarium austroafricanum]|uniref:Uncharacterized protein n=1 Tax=Fusarium austroafricanum TaxID=2364996 RepID=A0A8H4P1Q8_9HYPO|nr:hypothetical protein F53441_10916 [Fusarium austroafricanum]